MRVCVLQSSYMPWRGFFDLIDSVDVAVIHDHVPYARQDRRNRTRIKTAYGMVWLTVPVQYHAEERQTIDEIVIDESRDWAAGHLERVQANYKTAPFFARYFHFFAEILNRKHSLLSELNMELLQWGMRELGITTALRSACGLVGSGSRTECVIQILRATGATHCVASPTAKKYLDARQFEVANIGLAYKSYNYLPYPQLWDTYQPAVSILDTLFMLGPDARAVLKSQTPHEKIL